MNQSVASYVRDYDTLQSTFHELLLNHGRSNITFNNGCFKTSILDLPLEETLSIMPRYNTNEIISIARQAVKGDLTSMYTLSKLYTVGLGVPVSKTLAYAWATHSIGEVGVMEFQKVVTKLKEHLIELPADTFVFPSIVDRIYTKMLRKIRPNATLDSVPETSYSVTPIMHGAKATLIYRIHSDKEGRSCCYLYDFRIGSRDAGERISLDVAQKLNIPYVLGTHNNADTIPDYISRMGEYLDGPTTYIVVTGSLVLPKSCNLLVGESLGITKLGELLRYFLDTLDKPRIPYVTMSELDAIDDELTAKETLLLSIKDGSALKKLRSAIKSHRRHYDRSKAVGARDKCDMYKQQFSDDRDLHNLYKSVKYKRSLARDISKLLDSRKQVAEEDDKLRTLHESQYPENLFEFIASDLYGGSKGKVSNLPLGKFTSTHLKGLGFKSFLSDMRYNSLTVNRMKKRSFTEAVSKFETMFEDYKVVGLNLRPSFSETVNMKNKKRHVLTIMCE